MNFGWLHAPPFPPASCHGLVVQTDLSLILVDTGIGSLTSAGHLNLNYFGYHDVTELSPNIDRYAVE